MNSDERRILAQFDRHDPGPNPYAFSPTYYGAENLRNRVANNPAILVPVLVLVATVVYQAAAQNGQLPPLGSLLWDTLVRILPARLLFAFDDWLNPPLFPNPMLQTADSHPIPCRQERGSPQAAGPLTDPAAS